MYGVNVIDLEGHAHTVKRTGTYAAAYAAVCKLQAGKGAETYCQITTPDGHTCGTFPGEPRRSTRATALRGPRHARQTSGE
jgi:hypothetical protein